jgi:hypothetical protein
LNLSLSRATAHPAPEPVLAKALASRTRLPYLW